MEVISNLKLIKPTTTEEQITPTTLKKGEMAFGEKDEVGVLYGNVDGTKVLKFIGQDPQDIEEALDKLDTIEEGAEVNVQSDWNETDTTADAYIKNKPPAGAYTLDFFEDAYIIQDVNMNGNVIINAVEPYNVSKVYISFDDIVKEEIDLTNPIEIEISYKTRIIWEIERTVQGQLASLGVAYIYQ